jgi:hypothetical protein
MIDFLDVHQVGGRLLQAVLQTNQQVGTACVYGRFRAVLGQDLDRLIDSRRAVDGNLFHACLRLDNPAMIFSRVIGCSRIRTPLALKMALEIAPGTAPIEVSLKLFTP